MSWVDGRRVLAPSHRFPPFVFLPVLVAALAVGGCATGGANNVGCSNNSDCPAGFTCVEGICRGGGDADADGDGDEADVPVDDDGAEVDGETTPPTAVPTGFVTTGGAISGFNGTYRYQFSVGAPQPMGAGAGWVLGPGGVHRR